MPFAQESLANYLTSNIRDVVRDEVISPSHGQEKLYSAPRIFNDLLSSQPLCFNLFGELKADLGVASEVCRALWPERVGRVTSIEFEWSPGRRSDGYIANRSAFDVTIFFTSPTGSKGFIGIEVKYHENLKVKAATHREIYDTVAAKSGVFDSATVHELADPPLQQIWLDHLLALSMLQADDGYDDGFFVFLYPADNAPCEVASARYEEHLVDTRSFHRLTLEQVVAAVRDLPGQVWIELFVDRYLPAT